MRRALTAGFVSIALICLVIFGPVFFERSSDVTVRVDAASPPAGPAIDASAPAPEVIDCYTEEQLFLHPAVLSELAFMDAIHVHAPGVENHVPLSARALESLALQGDSAAMAVLGARQLLLAHGFDADRVGGFLMTEGPLSGKVPSQDRDLSYLTLPIKQDFSDEARQHAVQARRWFWQAALHGRYWALEQVGKVTHQLDGGAVELGWVSQQSYETMPSRERNALFPVNVYMRAAVMLTPEEALDGFFLGLSRAMLVGSDRQTALATTVAEQVRLQQQSRNITVNLPSTADLLSEGELLAMLCDNAQEKPSHHSN